NVQRFGGNGILVSGGANNSIAGNYIGTNATGTAALGNANWGVVLQLGAKLNRIGTDGNGVADSEERNVISGNGLDGAHIVDAATQNVVAGNYIGTDITGTAALGNGRNGVILARGAFGNRIGADGSNDASNANERNIISGNLGHGVTIQNVGSDQNVVAGNF